MKSSISHTGNSTHKTATCTFGIIKTMPLSIIILDYFIFFFIWKEANRHNSTTHNKCLLNLFHQDFIPPWAIYCFVDNEVSSFMEIIEFVCLFSSNCQSNGLWFLILVWQFSFYSSLGKTLKPEKTSEA